MFDQDRSGSRETLRERLEAHEIFQAFERTSLNGVICSIPDTGLDTPPHRTWCVHCQRLWKRLRALGFDGQHGPAAALSRPSEGSEPSNPRLSPEQREGTIKRGMWYREDGRTFLCIEVAPGADLSCAATREDALRKAEGPERWCVACENGDHSQCLGGACQCIHSSAPGGSVDVPSPSP